MNIVPWTKASMFYLGKDGPGIRWHDAGDPDEHNHSPGSSHPGPGVESERVTDCLVPAETIFIKNL